MLTKLVVQGLVVGTSFYATRKVSEGTAKLVKKEKMTAQTAMFVNAGAAMATLAVLFTSGSIANTIISSAKDAAVDAAVNTVTQ